LIKEAGQSELNEYQENGDFELSDFSATSTVFQYSCCEEFYLEISYRLELRRRPLYYVFNLILPCLLMNSLALVTFCMPCESGEKVTFSTCIFLTLILFFVLVRDILPPSHKTPLISFHYVITICLVASTTVFTVFSLNVHHQGRFDKEVPQCLRNVMLGSLAKFTCCKCSSDSECNHENQSDDEKSNVEHLSVNEDNKLWFGRIEQYKFSPRLRQRKETKEMSGNIDFFEDEHNKQHLKILSKIHESVKRNDMRMCEKKRRENNKSEWHQVSLVCDRLWLVLFLIASAVGTLLILLSSPVGGGLNIKGNDNVNVSPFSVFNRVRGGPNIKENDNDDMPSLSIFNRVRGGPNIKGTDNLMCHLFPYLTEVGGGLNIKGNDNVYVSSFSIFNRVGGGSNIKGNVVDVSSLSIFNRVGGGLNIKGNVVDVSSFSIFNRVEGGSNIKGNVVDVSSLSIFNRVGGGLNIKGNDVDVSSFSIFNRVRGGTNMKENDVDVSSFS
ncbi:neuronal acetylcholine receptor subunit alpha-7-like, partial [Tachypleus tridentatus]|uniref:neuronal acetylcholine receptor subunit alpha-7-like n=1 Tax=Tachypleus tridentatus TaxID=6853 RepID=UPI003FD5320A